MYLSRTRHKRQQGAALIIVLFIVIVFGFIVLAANRDQVRSSEQLISSVLGARADMAAQSAAQMDISQFYLSSAGSCYSGDSSYEFSGDGLQNCSATVSCEEIGQMDDERMVYKLTSSGSCKAGSTVYQRQIEIGIRDDD